MAYIVYKLMCLKDPSRYYGKPSGDAIDIINVAINAKQAKNVFFKGFQSKIKNCPWFAGKFYAKTESIEFDKAITVHSGHSERESHEGLNLFVAVLDEISGFALEGASASSKSSDAIYKAFRGTVDSRFAETGKCIAKDSLVWTDNGLQEIGDIYGHQSMIVGGSGSLQNISGWYNDGASSGLKITNWHGVALDATDDHKIYALVNGVPGYYHANALTNDDYVAMHLGGATGSPKMTKDEAFTLGVWVAEGSSFNRKNTKSSVIVMGADAALMSQCLPVFDTWREQFAVASIHNNRKMRFPSIFQS